MSTSVVWNGYNLDAIRAIGIRHIVEHFTDDSIELALSMTQMMRDPLTVPIGARIELIDGEIIVSPAVS